MHPKRFKGEGGKEVKNDDFVSFTSYFSKWKKDSPQLKVSRPVKDICTYCFTFANSHRYLAWHDNATPGEDKTIWDITSLLATINIDEADSAAMVAAKVREVLLLESAEHEKIARVQRLL